MASKAIPLLRVLGALAFSCAFVTSAHAEQGLASFYGYHERAARLTACGNVFNPYGLTAAHRTLPCGTRVRVICPDTMQQVDVTVDDRGPFIKGRIIDLSYGAARRLGIVGRGVAHVLVVRLR